MKPRNTLLIANNFPPVRGGSAVVYDNIAKFSDGAVTVLAPIIDYTTGKPMKGWREHDAEEGAARICRLPILRTPISSENNGSILNRLLFVLADLCIRFMVASVVLWFIIFRGTRHICIGELVPSAWIVSIVKRIPGIATSVYIHGEEITTVEAYDRNGARRTKTLLEVDRIIVVSNFTRGVVIKFAGPEVAAKIVLIPNGVDKNKFRPARKSETLRARYQLFNRGITFVSVCRILEKKGVDNALRAFSELTRKLPGSIFLVVGDGPYLPALKTMVRDLNLTESVIFTGQVPEEELADHYRLGDVFIMPNRALDNGDTEGFGLVFLEANACGLPVIAGCDGGSTDAVTHEYNGLVVNGRDIGAITDAMARLSLDADLRARVISNGLDLVNRSGWDERAEKFNSILPSRA